MTEETKLTLSIIGSVIFSILYILIPRGDDKLRDEARREKEHLPEILQGLREYRANLEMKRLRMTATRIYVLHKPRKMTKKRASH